MLVPGVSTALGACCEGWPGEVFQQPFSSLPCFPFFEEALEVLCWVRWANHLVFRVPLDIRWQSCALGLDQLLVISLMKSGMKCRGLEGEPRILTWEVFRPRSCVCQLIQSNPACPQPRVSGTSRWCCLALSSTAQSSLPLGLVLLHSVGWGVPPCSLIRVTTNDPYLAPVTSHSLPLFSCVLAYVRV